jgi:CheY-like chemotaxis protein
MRILYVEDNPANISLLQRVARMGGHDVIAYNDGEVALSHFKRDKPDLILMDLQLAGALGGLDVVRKLRADGIKTPIVAVTAYAMVGDRERCLEAGCDGYIAKPLPVAEVVEMVQRYAAAMKSKEAQPTANQQSATETPTAEAPKAETSSPAQPPAPVAPAIAAAADKPPESAPAAPVTAAAEDKTEKLEPISAPKVESEKPTQEPAKEAAAAESTPATPVTAAESKPPDQETVVPVTATTEDKTEKQEPSPVPNAEAAKPAPEPVKADTQPAQRIPGIHPPAADAAKPAENSPPETNLPTNGSDTLKVAIVGGKSENGKKD